MAVQEPSRGERDEERHPAFGMIGASRVSTGGSGVVLFDSDIRHRATVRLQIHTASRRRDIQHDWIHPDRQIIEVEMSEAQWASFVSSMNTSGVPCTLRWTAQDADLPGMPYQPRLAETMQETNDAANRSYRDILAAFAEVEDALATGGARQKREALMTLKARIQNAVPNIDYATKTLSEHAENVVQKARADIEAMVTHKAAQLGLDPGDAAGLVELGPGETLR